MGARAAHGTGVALADAGASRVRLVCLTGFQLSGADVSGLPERDQPGGELEASGCRAVVLLN